MKETEYHYEFTDDDPGNIVEALNTDREYMLYEIDSNSQRGIVIIIDPLGIKVKIIS